MNPSGEPLPRGRGRGMWKQHQESHKELRRPQSDSRVGVAGNNTAAAVSERSAEEDISKTSNLSANAKEFYPKGYQQSSQNQDCCNSSQFEEHQLQGGGDGQTHSAAKTNNDRITTSHLIDVMHHLTLNPGRFDALINPMADSFRAWLSDKDKIHFIVNAILEQSIDEPNFRYNGARLCSFLNNEFSPASRSSFRSCLLTRCKEEHTRMPNHIHTDPKRLHGFVMFMAELYMQLEVTKGCGMRIAVLGAALIEALNLLLTYPLPENIKCACQVLKLTGAQLDAQEPLNMNQIMQTLLHYATTMQVDPSSCRLINSVVELRQSRWGESTTMSSNSTTNQSFNSYPQQDGPVFYGPDGQIMTPEESQFLQESAAKIPDNDDYDEYGDDNLWEGDNEMDEEIEAAYEQFLMGKNQAHSADKSNG